MYCRRARPRLRQAFRQKSDRTAMMQQTGCPCPNPGHQNKPGTGTVAGGLLQVQTKLFRSQYYGTRTWVN